MVSSEEHITPTVRVPAPARDALAQRLHVKDSTMELTTCLTVPDGNLDAPMHKLHIHGHSRTFTAP
ncbi:hypothetical protein LIA77_06586 [Sarocladium implicatum]|nr:hypothetical protein LIA77_06586 [Sarocladium implicatum]